MGGRIVSIVCAVLAIVGIVILAHEYRDYNAEQQKSSKVYAELSSKLTDLEAEKRDVQVNILRLEESIEKISASKATLNVIFTDMSDVIYTEVLPLMNEYGLKGTIAMSANELPGDAGRLTDQQVRHLVGEGWDIIPRYSEGDGDIGIQSSVDWITQYGYDAKATVMIDEDDLTPEVEEQLVAAGYTTLVLNMNDSADGIVVKDGVEKVWKPRSIGYLNDDRKSILADALRSNGHVAFTVGFDENASTELYGERVLSSMLGYIDSLCQSDSLVCSSVHDTKTYRAESDLKRNEAESKAREQMDEYVSKLEEIEKAIGELYKKYE